MQACALHPGWGVLQARWQAVLEAREQGQAVLGPQQRGPQQWGLALHGGSPVSGLPGSMHLPLHKLQSLQCQLT